MAAQIVQNPGVSNRGRQDNPPQAQEERHVNGDAHAALRNRVGESGTSVIAHRSEERSLAGRDQNPELLQWRANVLLDEMMLGAVDIAASDVVATPARPARTGRAIEDAHNEATSRSRAKAEETPSSVHPTRYDNSVYQDERHAPVTDERGDERGERHAPSDPQDEWARPSWHFAEPTVSSTASSSPLTPSARAAALQEHTRHHQTPPSSPPVSHRSGPQPASAPDLRTTAVGAPPSRSMPAAKESPGKSDSGKKVAEQWVFAAEQRYQQIAARHQATPPAPGASGSMGASAAGATAAWVDPVDALFDDFAANDYGLHGVGGAAQRGGRPRVTQSGRRSNLLPRMSTLEPRALQQEMVLLQTEIEQALPAGHESRERALHLLQKAYTILQADPSRSAEVDYYLQQVRTMGQRVQETLHWSNLYHRRLNLYLAAWTALSLIVITSRYIYQDGLVGAIASMSGVDVALSLLPHNLLTAFVAFFGGALGGALGAFIDMRQYAQVKQGFFDRKYSLRGLILPLIGGTIGLILCLFFGLFYSLFGADPATNLLLGALPALFAFAFGIAQEFIYGTRS